MHIALGNNNGIPKVTDRNNGAVTPIKAPQVPPHIKPHNKTGKCMGQSIFPICGICPVKNGRI